MDEALRVASSTYVQREQRRHRRSSSRDIGSPQRVNIKRFNHIDDGEEQRSRGTSKDFSEPPFAPPSASVPPTAVRRVPARPSPLRSRSGPSTLDSTDGLFPPRLRLQTPSVAATSSAAAGVDLGALARSTAPSPSVSFALNNTARLSVASLQHALAELAAGASLPVRAITVEHSFGDVGRLGERLSRLESELGAAVAECAAKGERIARYEEMHAVMRLHGDTGNGSSGPTMALWPERGVPSEAAAAAMGAAQSTGHVCMYQRTILGLNAEVEVLGARAEQAEATLAELEDPAATIAELRGKLAAARDALAANEEAHAVAMERTQRSAAATQASAAAEAQVAAESAAAEARASVEKRNAFLLARFIAMMRNRCVVRCFESLQEFAGVRRRARRVMQRLVNRVKKDGLARAIAAWRQHLASIMVARQQEEERAALQRDMAQERERLLGDAQRSLDAQREQIIHMQTARVVARWRNGTMVRILHAWRSDAAEAKRHRNLLARFVAQMRQRCVVSCFENWNDFTGTRQRARRAMRSMIARVTRRGLSKGMGTWKWAMAERLAQDARQLEQVAKRSCAEAQAVRDEVQTREESRKVLLLARFIATMRSRTVVRCFENWSANAAERKRNRWLVTRFVATMRNRTAVRCFTAWASYVAMRKRARRVMQRLLDRVERGGLMRAMTSWRFHLTALALEDARANAKAQADAERVRVAIEVEEQRTRIIEQQTARVVARWRNGTMVRILHAWRADAAEAKRHRNLLARFVAQMRQRCVVSCFENWNDFTGTRQRARRVMNGLINRVERGRLVHGLTAWRRFTTAVQLEETVAAFEEKLEAERSSLSADQQELRAKIAREREALQEREATRQEGVVAKVIARMRQQCASSAFQGWHSAVLERKRNRWLVTKFVATMRDRTAVRCFTAWGGFARRRVSARRVMQRLVDRVEKGGLMRALTSWRFHLAGIALVDERKRLRQLAEEEQGAQRMKIIEQQTARVVARWRNGTMVRILHAWRVDAAEAKRHRNLLARFVGLMRNRIAARLMGRWADFVNERKRARAVVARALRRMQAGDLVAGMAAWKHHIFVLARLAQQSQALKELRAEREKIMAREATRQEGVVAKVIARMRQQCASSAFQGWHSAVQERKRNRWLVTKFVATMRNRTVVRCFTAWAGYMALRERSRRVLHRLTATKASRGLAKALASWKLALAYIDAQGEIELERVRVQEEAEEELEAQRLQLLEGQAKRVMARWRNGTMVRILHAWRADAAEAKRHRNLLARFVAQMRQRCVVSCFENWDASVRIRQRARRMMRRMINRVEKGGLVRAIASWRRCLAIMDTEHAVATSVAVLSADHKRLVAEAQGEAKRISQQRRQAFLARTGARITYGSLAMCFDKWRRQMEALRRQEAGATRLILHATNRKLSNAWRMWWGILVQRQRRSEAATAKAVRALHARRRMQLMLAMARWRFAWRQDSATQRAKAAAKRSIMRVVNRDRAVLTAAVGKWRTVTALEYDAREALSRAEKRRVSDTQQLHNALLLERERSVGTSERLTARVMANWQGDRQARIFHAWAALARRAGSRRRKVKMALDRMNNNARSMRLAWAKLSGVHMTKVRRESMMSQAKANALAEQNKAQLQEMRVMMAQAEVSKCILTGLRSDLRCHLPHLPCSYNRYPPVARCPRPCSTAAMRVRCHTCCANGATRRCRSFGARGRPSSGAYSIGACPDTLGGLFLAPPTPRAALPLTRSASCRPAAPRLRNAQRAQAPCRGAHPSKAAEPTFHQGHSDLEARHHRRESRGAAGAGSGSRRCFCF